jgi:hypothetical protein
VLAEKIGVINPHSYENLEELREYLVDIIDERLDEMQYIPWVEKGDEFRFLRAATIVFDTGLDLHTPHELVKNFETMSTSSFYYHFLEARRRTEEGTDDFTAWLKTCDKVPERLIEILADIDFYFLNLAELKKALIDKTAHLEERDLYYD